MTPSRAASSGVRSSPVTRAPSLAAVTATGAGGLVSLDYSCLLHLQGLSVPAARDLKFYHLAEILAMSG